MVGLLPRPQMYWLLNKRRRSRIESASPWVPDGASLYLDFMNGRYFGAQPQIIRPTSGLMLGPSGYQSFAPDTLRRIDGFGALVEPGSVNLLPNSSMAGAAIGVIGDGGSLPTGWAFSKGGNNDLTVEVVGLGVENGLNYFDLRMHGTTNGNQATLYCTGYLPITGGETATYSVFARIIDGVNNLNFRTRISGNFDGSWNDDYIQIVLDGSAERRISTLTTKPTTNTVICGFQMATAAGAVTDFTARIAQPQVEKSSFATSPIITEGAQASRAGDLLAVGGLGKMLSQGVSGVFQMDWLAVESFRVFLDLSDGAFSNRAFIEVGSTDGPRWNGTIGGVSQGVGAVSAPEFRKTGLMTVAFAIGDGFRSLRVVGDTQRDDHGKALPPNVGLVGIGGTSFSLGNKPVTRQKRLALLSGPVDQTSMDRAYALAQEWAS